MNNNEFNHSNILQIIQNFNISGEIETVDPFGTGHINDTYKVSLSGSKRKSYLLQRINHNVFKNVPALIGNILYVTNHIREKLGNAENVDKKVLTLIQCRDGNYYYQEKNGNYWRIYLFIENTRSYDVVENAKQAFEGGKAFGQFQTLLSDLDAKNLSVTIPDFHHLPNRLMQLEKSLEADNCERKKNIVEELNFIKDREYRMMELQRLADSGRIPLRVTHNDTKFNNVLLNEYDESQCVIDLDTVMPGYTAFDFGDAVRTLINKGKEDEEDLKKIQLDIDMFEAFTNGFMQQTINHLHTSEIRSLLDGVLLLPFLIGVRFLTDYINGDIYFKTKFPHHNLQRARAQFQLVKKLEEHGLILYQIIMESTNLRDSFG